METNSLAFSLARECRKCTSHGFVLSLLHVGRSVSQSRRSAVLESINLRVSCHYRGYFFVRFAQRLLSISILALDPHTHTPARALASQIHPKAARMDCVEIRYRYCFVFSSVSYIARVELWATSSVCMHTRYKILVSLAVIPVIVIDWGGFLFRISLRHVHLSLCFFQWTFWQVWLQ